MGKIPFLLNMGKCVTNSWVTKVLNHHLLTDDSLKSEMHLIYYFKRKHIFENERQSPVRKENEGTLEPRSEYSYWVNRCFRRTEDITGNSICSLFASPTFPCKENVDLILRSSAWQSQTWQASGRLLRTLWNAVAKGFSLWLFNNFEKCICFVWNQASSFGITTLQR